ncbi:uncharacterized protein LOC111710854 [Eurytemora carolleeae]|uniref:uncharacterized protein LOC111710854 n=1 Tax=Eurytemora carolleeae TaxID=1294199 RepID=UPI000C770656|nr:uncharacterized protein LOC111710854 [Eurytemora carolleeae]|eukprot:XP_023340791.1 uncharacterized protein LOC111710854 [Eurytemora affinis]
MQIIVLIAGFGLVGTFAAPQLYQLEAVDSSVDEVENEKVDKITNKEYAEVPYTVVERIVYDDLSYEIRDYPAVMWVCTRMVFTQEEDLLESENIFDEEDISENENIFENEYKTMKDQPSSQMYIKLFRYISGFNSAKQEIKMTIPVRSKISQMENKSSVHETCFYLDPAVQVDPPTPLQEDLTILETQPCREENIFCNLRKTPQTNYQTKCFNPVLTSICIELNHIHRNIKYDSFQ